MKLDIRCILVCFVGLSLTLISQANSADERVSFDKVTNIVNVYDTVVTYPQPS